MRRSPLQRKTALHAGVVWITRKQLAGMQKAGAFAKRRTPLHPVTRNTDKRKRVFAKTFHSNAFVAFVHARGCAVRETYYQNAYSSYRFGCLRAPVEVSHVRSRGAGGGWRENTLPLCRFHHALYHAIGKDAFQARTGLDAQNEATLVTAAWEATR